MHQRIELIILHFFRQSRQFGGAEAGLQARGFVHRQDRAGGFEAAEQLKISALRFKIALRA